MTTDKPNAGGATFDHRSTGAGGGDEDGYNMATGTPTHSDVRNWANACDTTNFGECAQRALIRYVDAQEARESEAAQAAARVAELEGEATRLLGLLNRIHTAAQTTCLLEQLPLQVASMWRAIAPVEEGSRGAGEPTHWNTTCDACGKPVTCEVRYTYTSCNDCGAAVHRTHPGRVATLSVGEPPVEPAECNCAGGLPYASEHKRSCPRNPAYDVTPQCEPAKAGDGGEAPADIHQSGRVCSTRFCQRPYGHTGAHYWPLPSEPAGGQGPTEALRKEIVAALRKANGSLFEAARLLEKKP